MKNNLIIITIFVFFALQISCGIYSFTGASYGTATTVCIEYFENRSAIINPTLSQTLTEDLKNKFNSQTPLKQIESDGDLYFEGEIVDYSTTPIGIQAGETAASNRLTIKVNVRFTNSTNPLQNFDRQYSDYEDYPSTTNFTSVENELVSSILKKIIDKIFNDAVVNW